MSRMDGSDFSAATEHLTWRMTSLRAALPVNALAGTVGTLVMIGNLRGGARDRATAVPSAIERKRVTLRHLEHDRHVMRYEGISRVEKKRRCPRAACLNRRGDTPAARWN